MRLAKYFFRIDDIAPNMNWDNFYLLEEILRKYDIKPLVAVIPDVRDPKLIDYPVKAGFWQTIKKLRDAGWIVAQHGYQHISTGDGGILGIHRSGEFGGIDLKTQETMISAGREIMEMQGLVPDVFVAPRHSFDNNTIKALKQYNFGFISDGIALWPFKKLGLIWLPQILWRPRKIMFGFITIAIHPNTMSRLDIENFEKFIKYNREKIGNFDELMSWYDHKNMVIRLITFIISQPFKVFWRIIFKIKFLFK